MKTPTDISPYVLIQEILRDEPWQLLVAVICLNLTSARQAYSVLKEMFEKFPTPESVASVDASQLEPILKPLGLHRKRSQTIVKMSKAYLKGFSDPLQLPGIGKYGADSYNMFVNGFVVWDVEDKELKNYVKWVEEIYGRK